MATKTHSKAYKVLIWRNETGLRCLSFRVLLTMNTGAVIPMAGFAGLIAVAVDHEVVDGSERSGTRGCGGLL